MKQINAFWDEIGGQHLLVVPPFDSEGNEVSEDLNAGWVRESLPTLAEKAKRQGFKIWIGEEDRFL